MQLRFNGDPIVIRFGENTRATQTAAVAAAASAAAAAAALATFEGAFGWAANAAPGSTSNYTITTYGPGVVRLLSTGASPQTRWPIKATALNGWMTFYVLVAAKSSGAANQLTLYQTGGAASALSNPLRQDGTWQAVELQATLLAATHVRATNAAGSATGDNWIAIVPVPGRATDTDLSAPLADEHSRMRAMVGKEIEWNGHVRAPAATNSVVTDTTICGFTFNKTEPSGSDNFSIPLNSSIALNGESLTFLYVARNGTGLAPSVIPKTNGGGAAAADDQLMLFDGVPHKMTFTLTADATQLNGTVTGQASYFNCTHFIVPGTVADDKLPSLAAIFLGIAEMVALPAVDATARGIGHITAAPENENYDSIVAEGFWAFEAVKTGAIFGTTYRAALQTRGAVLDDKVTLVIVCSAREDQSYVTGVVKSRYYNSGTKSNQVTLDTTGAFDVHELTLTGSASDVWIEVPNTDADFRCEAFILNGHASSTEPGSGTEGAFLALVNMLKRKLAEKVGERWGPERAKILYTSIFGIAGRHVTIYPRQLFAERKRLHKMDVALVSAPSDSYGVDPGEALAVLSSEMIRVPASDLTSATAELHAIDPEDARITYALTANVHIAPATVTTPGTAYVWNLGDSYGALYRPHLRTIVETTGLTWQGVGASGSGADLHDAISGTSLSDWVGRKTNDTNIYPDGNPLSGASLNKFLRAADGTDKSANPTMCFATSGGTSTRRPSYDEDDTQPTYVTFDFAAAATALSVDTAAKIALLITHWVNSAGDGASAVYEDWLELMVTDYAYVVANFHAVFAAGRTLIALQGVHARTGAESGVVDWRSHFAPSALALIEQFRGQEGSKRYIVPCWAHQSLDINANTASSGTADPETGTVPRTVTDPTHNRSWQQRQAMEPVAGAICWLAETYGV